MQENQMRLQTEVERIDELIKVTSALESSREKQINATKVLLFELSTFCSSEFQSIKQSIAKIKFQMVRPVGENEAVETFEQSVDSVPYDHLRHIVKT